MYGAPLPVKALHGGHHTLGTILTTNSLNSFIFER